MESTHRIFGAEMRLAARVDGHLVGLWVPARGAAKAQCCIEMAINCSVNVHFGLNPLPSRAQHANANWFAGSVAEGRAVAIRNREFDPCIAQRWPVVPNLLERWESALFAQEYLARRLDDTEAAAQPQARLLPWLWVYLLGHRGDAGAGRTRPRP